MVHPPYAATIRRMFLSDSSVIAALAAPGIIMTEMASRMPGSELAKWHSSNKMLLKTYIFTNALKTKLANRFLTLFIAEKCHGFSPKLLGGV